MSPTCSKAELARKPKGLSKGAACVTCAQSPRLPSLRSSFRQLTSPAQLFQASSAKCAATPSSRRARPVGARRAGEVRTTRPSRVAMSSRRRVARRATRTMTICCDNASARGAETALRRRMDRRRGRTAPRVRRLPSSRSRSVVGVLLTVAHIPADLLSSPPSPAPFDLESLFAFPIPSFPAVTAPSPSASSSFVLPQLPSLDNGYGDDFATPPASVPISAQWATLEGAADAGYDSRESLVRDLAASMSGPPQWMSPLESSGFFLAGDEAALPGGPAPQYASGLVASPASYLDFSLELGLAPCPAMSPVVGSSSTAFPALASPSGPAPAFDLPCPVAPCPPFSSSSCSSPSRRTAPPTHIDLPASDPADPFAAAFGQALAERLCAGASQLSL